MSASAEIEEGLKLSPPFDRSELLPCITQDADTGEVLMMAYMNREALDKTIQTRKATYYSRSRKSLWVKGETSGQIQEVQDVLIDCDQDCILIKVRMKGGAACHVGYRSCFFRRLKPGSADELETIYSEKVFDPKEIYKK